MATSARGVDSGRLGVAVAVSTIVVLLAPFLGQARNWLRQTCPSAFVELAAGVVAVAIAASFGVAVWRIRPRRIRSYAGLAVALALVVGYMATFRTGNPEVDAVEAVHFLEYGLIGALYYRAFLPAASPAIPVLALLSGMLVGTAEEWLQWVVPIRVGVAQDVLLNTVSLVAGIAFAASVAPPAAFSWRLQPGSAQAASRLAAVALVVFAGFVHCAHLGYEIVDREVGTFRSYFTREELLTLRAARQREWQAQPPQELKLVGIEDYYLTEAGWRVQARNDAEIQGAFRRAALENRILERYYAPFLAVPSFLGRGPHRWTAEQRANVEAAAAEASAATSTEPAEVDAASYVSPVLANRIAVRPTKTEWWLATAAAAMVLWFAPQVWIRRDRRKG